MLREDNRSIWCGLHSSFEDAKIDESLAASWKKSIKRGIDYKTALPKEVGAQEFDRTKQSFRRLMICSDWVINHLIENCGSSSLRVLLFSRDGILLRIYGLVTSGDWLAERGIRVGGRWLEDTIGTNVFTMGVRKKQTMFLPGCYNFSEFLADGAYYYAPICLSDGDIHGSIILCVPIEEADELLFSLAVSVVRTIELDMFLFQSVEMFTGVDSESGSIFLQPDNGDYKVVLINDQVFRILGIDKTDNYHLSLDALISPYPSNREFWSLLSSKRNITEREIQLSIKSGGKVVVDITIVHYTQNKFHPDGITVSFSASGEQLGKPVKYNSNMASHTFNDIICEDETMLETKKRSRIAAWSDSNILISGESGTGKDVFAQAIHNASKRGHRPFVAINCAAFSKELIASELFGYESGAFTGAKREGSMGKFELANGGTLFMDEIGDMPMEVQSVLLRVLEEKAFRKVGGNKLIAVDVRIIAATNKNLKELIEQKLFREDLFYRLSVIRINIPPLRNRGNDVYLFTDYYIKKICRKLDKPEITLTKGALDFLGRYSWPGNIRELQNLLEGIISTHEETLIGDKEIENYLGEYFLEEPKSRSAEESVINLSEDEQRIRILEALSRFNNNRSKAAGFLGMSRSTFYRRMQELNINNK